jgi:putative nucleotidyltransferase with HDIG domain
MIPLLFSNDNSVKYTDLKVGSISAKRVVAPYNFFVLKTDEELAADKKKAVEAVPYFFIYNDSLTKATVKTLQQILTYLSENEPRKKSLANNNPTAVDNLIGIRDELRILYNVNISTAYLTVLYSILDNRENSKRIKLLFPKLINKVRHGIMNIGISEIKRPNVVVIRNGVEENWPEEKWVDEDSIRRFVRRDLEDLLDDNQTAVLNEFIFSVVKPNLIFDKEFTDRELDDALANVSLTKDMVYENELIIDANERIDQDVFQKLYSLEVSKIDRSHQEGRWQSGLLFIARMMLVAAIFVIIGLYLYSFRKSIFYNNKMVLLIAIIIFLEILTASIITNVINWPVYLIPTTIASMLLAILIDSGIAFVSTVAIALVLGGIQGSGYDITLLTLVSGMVSIFSVHHIRRRNQVLRAILLIALSYFWVVVAFGILRADPIIDSLKTFLFYLAPNAVLAPFITFMLIGIFERIFDITTDITLLELSDLNHPILKKLSLEAPGTFHHSMVVGNLAESAAKEIGANSLLARVGSYYHDIGKIEKPEYFAENQMNSENAHSKLSPHMSALILASHVKNGLEMAEKAKLPRLIRDFIPEHHGTNIMEYFYRKAVENEGESTISESDFRYPGPKPQSKETAIVMLADTAEAATRTLKNPTPSRIKSFIDGLIKKRVDQGELDECDLTISDLKKISDAFMKILLGVFQHRVVYPDQEKQFTASDKKKKEKSNGNTDSQSDARGSSGKSSAAGDDK